MELLKVEKSVNVNRNLSREVQLELLKLHKPKKAEPPPPPPPERKWLRLLGRILALFSVRESIVLHREIGPGLRRELIERKERQRLSF